MLGDKEDPAKTAPLNEGHVLDLAELGAREDGGDVIYEIKVPSPLYKKGLRGLGSPAGERRLLGGRGPPLWPRQH